MCVYHVAYRSALLVPYIMQIKRSTGMPLPVCMLSILSGNKYQMYMAMCRHVYYANMQIISIQFAETEEQAVIKNNECNGYDSISTLADSDSERNNFEN